jgi:predicted unusual protein kinase regulating ubiquinone biosynthesis (AarF/ABC1/UbiB family)
MRALSKFLLFIRRLGRIIWVSFGLLFKRDLTGPEKLRTFFEETGGAFVKFGQILALRQDFIPLCYTVELLKLLNTIPEVPFAEMQRIFSEDMGWTIGDFFAEFDAQSIASGTVGQVYKARLKNGDLVAVKIRRPNIVRDFEGDFMIAFFLAAIMDFFKLFSAISAHAVVSDFVVWTRRELDFTYEAKNAEAIYDHSASHPRTIVPKQYLEHTTPRVLIQEFLEEGVPVDDIVFGKEDREFMVDNNIDVDELSLYLIADELRQYFVDGFFHADPHPANLVFMPNNNLAYLDFGIVGEAAPNRFLFLKFIYGVATKDIDYMSRHFFEFGQKILDEELEGYLKIDVKMRRGARIFFNKVKELIHKDFKKDLTKIIEPWFEALEDPNSTLAERNSARVFFKMVRKVEAYGGHMPKEIALFFRALAILDMVSLQVSPKFDMIKALGAFFEKYPLDEMEELINEGKHDEATEKIIPIDQIADWELFMEISTSEKEQIASARERIIDLIEYYVERYEDELRPLLKKIR